MIINSSVVGMAANTVQRTTYTDQQESYGMNLQNGTLNGGSNSFVKSYMNARADRLLQNNTRRDAQTAGRLAEDAAKTGKTSEDAAKANKPAEDTAKTGKSAEDAAKAACADISGTTARAGQPAGNGQTMQTDAVGMQDNRAQSADDGWYPNYGLNRIYRSGRARNEGRAAEDFMMQLRMYLFEMRNQMLMTIGQKRGNILSFAKNAGQTSIWNRLDYQSCTYEEQETMTFETEGKAVTADGRTITFNVQLEMSRAYSESVEYLTQSTSILTDPLVISLDANPVSVSDQKWQFDIDGDGKTDSISKLSKGSGYLVFDRNGDGVINDGTEMFGARTGNGFAELADYDEDGNGWIDENDSVYEKLAVWMKDDAGNDRMVGLKAANVGAIYLGSVVSDFAFKSMEDNQHNAQLRRSGVYLTEDGRANTIAQLDMVKALITG